MIEMLFEYTLSVIDYSYLLFFYLRLINKKWEWKKAVPAILGIAVVQFVKDSYLDFGSMSLVIDRMVVIVFLYICSFKYTINNFLYAIMIYCIFSFSVIFFAACAMELGVEISDVLAYGLSMERLVFSILVKTFTIILFVLLSNPLKKLHYVMRNKAENIMVLIMSLILFVFAYVFGNVEEKSSIFWVTLMISVIMISVFYLFYRYCMVLKQQADDKIIQYSIDITSDYVRNLEKEHAEVKKIRHDIMNKLTILEYLIEEEKYEEVTEVLSELSNSMHINKVSISGNIFIDAVLRQKMNEYKDIKFETEIKLSEDFNMGGNDLISLLSNIIDNACEELIRVNESSFILKIKGSGNQLSIYEENICRIDNDLVTDKNIEYHGYGLKIIEGIVNKYSGVVDFQVDQATFSLSILLPL